MKRPNAIRAPAAEPVLRSSRGAAPTTAAASAPRGTAPPPGRCGSRALALVALCASLAACGEDKPDAAGADPAAGAPVAGNGAVGEDAVAPSGDVLDPLRARERIAALAIEGDVPRALAVAAALAARPDASYDDMLGAAVLHYQMAKRQGPDMESQAAALRALLSRAEALDPDALGAPYLRALLASFAEYRPEDALAPLRRVRAARPDDTIVAILLADVLEQTGAYEDAARLYEDVRATGVASAGSAYRTATHKLGQLAIRHLGQRDRGIALIEETKALEAAGVEALGDDYELSDLAQVVWPTHAARPAGEPRAPASLAFEEALRVPLAAHARLTAVDVDGDGLVDLLGHDASTVVWARQQPDGAFASSVVDPGGVVRELHAADLDNDGALDWLVVLEDAAGGRRVVSFAHDAGTATIRVPGTPLAEDDDALACTVLDFDHDGDLDVAFATPTRGARLLRNDAPGGHAWADATPSVAAGLGACVGVLAEDLDGDSDVDLVVLRADGGPVLLSSLRGGAFEDVTAARLPDASRVGPDVRLADCNGDRLPDLLARDGDDLVLRPSTPAGFGPAERIPGAFAGLASSWTVADVDGDGHFDVLLPGADATRMLGGPLAQRIRPPAPQVVTGPSGGALRAADVLGRPAPEGRRRAVGDGRLELVQSVPGAAVVWRPVGEARGISLDLEGLKDNARGVGAVVEVRAGEHYQRVYARGERLVLGLGAADVADIVRVTWPNGVEQHVLGATAGAHDGVPAGHGLLMTQLDRHAGSCPFLYTWDGTRFVFVSDVLGATPLGLPLDAERFVPFDHDEYVKVRADQLVPDDDGVLRVAVTEELREVTYLDRLRLHAIDHPADVEIQPHEAFAFPPFPPHHVHTFRTLLAPARAVTNRAGDGAHGWGTSDAVPRTQSVPRAPLLPWDDAGAELATNAAEAASDGGSTRDDDARGMARHPAMDASRLAQPYADHADSPAPGGPSLDVAAWVATEDTRGPRPFKLAPPRLRGMTRPWSLDLEFGADEDERRAIRAAGTLRLVLTGWIEWGDASVNMAAARDPEWSFVPPVLWLPDGDGWRPAGPPVGFPAGKTKTMVVDVTDLLVRDDPRLRLVTSLEITWDRIALAVDDDDALFVDTPLEPRDAELSFRGFSSMHATGRDDLPELFDWTTRVDPPWNQHRGRFTRFGDVLPLLTAIDDEYVILAAGDVVHATFDARALPPLPDGWTRDWLLFLDGWAKDGDPNTSTSETVEPLPFHGMTAYPPPPGEEPADPAARAAWDAEWNTRTGRVLVPPLVSGAR